MPAFVRWLYPMQENEIPRDRLAGLRRIPLSWVFFPLALLYHELLLRAFDPASVFFDGALLPIALAAIGGRIETLTDGARRALGDGREDLGTEAAIRRISSEFLNVRIPEKETDTPRSTPVRASPALEEKQWRTASKRPRAISSVRIALMSASASRASASGPRASRARR